MKIKEDKQSLLTLARAFSSRVAVYFWRGEWHVWKKTYYEQVPQQDITQQVLSFLEQKAPPVTGSTISRFVDLLKTVRQQNSWVD